MSVGLLEKRHCFGGVETAIRCTDAALLAQLCAPYEEHPSDGRAPDLVVEYVVDPTVDEEPFRSDRERLIPTLDAEGVARFRGPAERHCFDVSLRLALLLAFPRQRGLILHGAAALGRGGALLFIGPSGAGKSTIFRLLGESGRFRERIADELLFVKQEGQEEHEEQEGLAGHEAGGWRIFATPFGGERHAAPQASAPVRAIYILRQAPRHRVLPLSRPAALAAILPQARVYTGTREAADDPLARATRLVADLPCFTLEFAKDPGVGAVLEEP